MDVKLSLATFVLSLSLANCSSAESVADSPTVAVELKKFNDAFPKLAVSEDQLIRYSAIRTLQKIQVDGKLDEQVWQRANKTPRFVDLITGSPTLHETRAAITWDDEALYVGYWLSEPNVEAKYEKRDDPIYYDNDVEIFVAGKDSYYELELNAKGTIYEAFFVWRDAYQKGNYRSDPQLAPGVPKSQPFDGVDLTGHPRGKRIVFLGYDLPGLKSGVSIDGTLNNSNDVDQGWTVELALPWSSLKWIAAGDNRSLPPTPGDQWRINLFRFNKYKAPQPSKDSGGWAVAKHGVWDSHLPELFPIVTFTEP